MHMEVILKKSSKKPRSTILFDFTNKKELTIGKSQTISDFILRDPSISDLHAFFKYENDEIYIEDC